ncbi:MAG: hypothetical protein P9L94_09620 [Candidatus Hinthialibacter antarcticus]|nr:hypothetical protein [Candidatus Hinthialibacter antarcticus]
MMNPLDGRWTVADVYEHTGLNCHMLGDLEDAKVMLTSAVEHGEQDNDDAEFLVSKYHNLAVIYFELNDFKTSDEYFHNALQCFVDNPNMDPEKLALLLNNYSLLMDRRKDSVLSEAFSICAEFVSSTWFASQENESFITSKPVTVSLMNVA